MKDSLHPLGQRSHSHVSPKTPGRWSERAWEPQIGQPDQIPSELFNSPHVPPVKMPAKERLAHDSGNKEDVEQSLHIWRLKQHIVLSHLEVQRRL